MIADFRMEAALSRWLQEADPRQVATGMQVVSQRKNKTFCWKIEKFGHRFRLGGKCARRNLLYVAGLCDILQGQLLQQLRNTPILQKGLLDGRMLALEACASFLLTEEIPHQLEAVTQLTLPMPGPSFHWWLRRRKTQSSSHGVYFLVSSNINITVLLSKYTRIIEGIFSN